MKETNPDRLPVRSGSPPSGSGGNPEGRSEGTKAPDGWGGPPPPPGGGGPGGRGGPPGEKADGTWRDPRLGTGEPRHGPGPSRERPPITGDEPGSGGRPR